jgi:hypothetical protein
MSRIAPALARRLDRLARHAHRFHRFAHHPLCEAYAPELVRLGRRARLCRGCTFSVLGALCGAALALITPLLGPALLLGPMLLTGWAALALAPRGGRAVSKLLSRAGPLALAGFLLVAGLRSAARAEPGDWSGAGTALVTLLLVAAGAIAWRKRGPDRTACLTCPQAPAGPRCDGLRPLARRERAFSRLASRWIARG